MEINGIPIKFDFAVGDFVISLHPNWNSCFVGTITQIDNESNMVTLKLDDVFPNHLITTRCDTILKYNEKYYIRLKYLTDQRFEAESKIKQLNFVIKDVILGLYNDVK